MCPLLGLLFLYSTDWVLIAASSSIAWRSGLRFVDAMWRLIGSHFHEHELRLLSESYCLGSPTP